MFSPKTNAQVLAASRGNLTTIERQRRFLLETLGAAMPCPNCGAEQSLIEATGATIDTFDATQRHTDRHACKSCRRELIYSVPLIRPVAGPGWHWQLVPIPVSA